MPETMQEPLQRSIGLVPMLSGTGGTASFQQKMIAGLANRQIETTFDLNDEDLEAILLVGGTRNLLELRRAKKRGINIFQRLDGMNWIHKKRRTGLRHYLKAERANLLLSWIRRHIASGIIYQSHFVHEWWESVYGPTGVPHEVVYNGVDLEIYSPEGEHDRPEEAVRILVVEGRLAGGYELGLEHAIEFVNTLAQVLSKPVELMVVGEAVASVRQTALSHSHVPVHWTGTVARERIPYLDRSAHLLFAADIHPACPNAVIEAIACGLPVVGFDTGALAEIVNERSGRIIPYGADPWELQRPHFEALANAAAEILPELEKFREGARQRAEEGFGLDRMVTGYLEAIDW